MMRTLIDDARGAVAPWNSIDSSSAIFDRTTQQDIDICLMCQHCADACDYCNGRGNLRKNGRPRINLDMDILRTMMKLRRSNKEICAAFNVSENTIIKAKKRLKMEVYG